MNATESSFAAMNATEVAVEEDGCDSAWFGQCGEHAVCARAAALNPTGGTNNEYAGQCACASIFGWAGSWPDCEQGDFRRDTSMALYWLAAFAQLLLFIYAAWNFRRRRSSCRSGRRADVAPAPRGTSVVTVLEVLLMSLALFRAIIYAVLGVFVMHGANDADVTATLSIILVNRVAGAASLPASVCAWMGMHVSGFWEGEPRESRQLRQLHIQERTVHILALLFVILPAAVVLVFKTVGQYLGHVLQLVIMIPSTWWLGMKVIRWIEDWGTSSGHPYASVIMAECRKSLKAILFVYSLQGLNFLLTMFSVLFPIFQGAWPGALVVVILSGVFQFIRIVVQLNNIYRLEVCAPDEFELECRSADAIRRVSVNARGEYVVQLARPGEMRGSRSSGSYHRPSQSLYYGAGDSCSIEGEATARGSDEKWGHNSGGHRGTKGYHSYDSHFYSRTGYHNFRSPGDYKPSISSGPISCASKDRMIRMVAPLDRDRQGRGAARVRPIVASGVRPSRAKSQRSSSFAKVLPNINEEGVNSDSDCEEGLAAGSKT